MSILERARAEHPLLSDVESPFSCPGRLVIGFETDQRCQMFADGLALIVAEAKERLAPRAPSATQATAHDDTFSDAASRAVRA